MFKNTKEQISGFDPTWSEFKLGQRLGYKERKKTL